MQDIASWFSSICIEIERISTYNCPIFKRKKHQPSLQKPMAGPPLPLALIIAKKD